MDNEIKKSELLISDFFQKDFVDYGSYDNTRKIASYIDGFKNAARKVMYTIMKKSSNNEIKVSVFTSDVMRETIYLHGPVSLEGVIVNLARDYVGSNNINLLLPEGSFGTRLVPKASAARYISTKRSKVVDQIFCKDDMDILEDQIFEGEKIEPRFMVPLLPLVLVNGSTGVSSGFAQKILPRKPQDLRRYILANLKGNKNKVHVNPYFEGFNGTIKAGSAKNSWEIYGKIKQEKKKVIIEELPIGYDLKSYIKVLDKLEDDGIIKSYKDLSNSVDDKFLFECTLPKIADIEEEELLNTFKLITKVTENFTCIDEYNQIREFEDVYELFDAFIDIRLEYYEKRRVHNMNKLKNEINEMMSKYEFIKRIISEDITINKKTKPEVITQLKEFPKIIKINDSYDYLLDMKLHTLTLERIKSLSTIIKRKVAELKVLKDTDSNEMWMTEVNDYKV